MRGIGRELRHAARRLVRSPAFTLASILTLGLAIGANTSIFAVVERVLLNPLPYPESDRLIDLDHGASPAGRNVPSGIQVSPGLYYQYLDRARSIESAALYRTDEQTLTGDGEPERIRIARVTASLASVLQVQPYIGRWFAPQQGAFAPISTPVAEPVTQVAVLSYGLWMRRYGGGRGVLSHPISLGGVSTEVIGIMPPRFAFPDARVDIWLPEQVRREPVWDTFMHAGVARLRPGVSAADARAELTGLIADLPRAYPNEPVLRGFMANLRLKSAARTLKDALVGRVANALWMVLASVGLVLLVACANVANLFLVRSDARERDIAVRRALGAGRGDIARFFLAESVWLATAGGAVGLLLAWAGTRLLVAFGPDSLPRLGEVHLDGVAMLFTLALAILTTLLFGAMPMWRQSALTAALHSGGRATASRSRHRLRHLLMGGQVALALMLLVASGLLVRSFQEMRAIDPAFDARSALTFRIGLPASAYPGQPAAATAQQVIVDRLSALPAVTGVSAATCLPLGEDAGRFTSTMRVQGRVAVPGVVPPAVGFCAVAGEYFEVMGTSVIRGRAIHRDDVERQQAVAVINQALASAYFGSEDPIGQRVTIGPPRNRAWLTIVGIVRNTPFRALAEPRPMAQLFLPMSIARAGELPVGPDPAVMSFVVRTSTAPFSVLPAARAAIKGIDASLALAQVRTLQETLDRASAQMAFTMVLLAIAAAVALLLGVVGIYGVMSYVVSQRTSEIGVRLALGAQPSSVAGMIVRQGGLVAAVGIAVGLMASWAGTRLIASMLYGVSPRDPVVFAATTVILLSVALIACWLPARQAAALNPIEALRAD